MNTFEFVQCRHRSEKALAVEIYNTVDRGDAKEWDRIADRNVFLSRDYLRALGVGDALVYIALFRLHGRIVGAASFQTAAFRGAPLDGYFQYRCPGLAVLARPIKFIQAPFASTVLVCGSPFAAGEHGFAFVDEVQEDTAAGALVRAAEDVTRDLARRGTLVDGILFKEFTPRAQGLAARLCQTRFTELVTEPAMVLYLDREWRTFDDYLSSLSSKYRVKANREFTKSKDLESRELSTVDLVDMRKQIEALYGAVAQRAAYKLGDLDMKTLIAMRAEMNDALVLKGYFSAGRLVGFLTGFVNGDTLEAGLVGFDYARNRQYAIYPRMLYDYLKIALVRGLSTVNYGRTASEIKSTLGAVPVQMSCCLRLQKSTLNMVLPLLSGSMRLKPFVWRKPFKQSWYESSGNAVVPGIFAAAEKHSFVTDLKGGAV